MQHALRIHILIDCEENASYAFESVIHCDCLIYFLQFVDISKLHWKPCQLRDNKIINVDYQSINQLIKEKHTSSFEIDKLK